MKIKGVKVDMRKVKARKDAIVNSGTGASPDGCGRPGSLSPFQQELRTPLNILFVGDIFGSAGRRIVREHIGHVREANDVELVIINAENAAGGFGVTPQIAEELFDMGADVLTTGNHVWDKRESRTI